MSIGGTPWSAAGIRSNAAPPACLKRVRRLRKTGVIERNVALVSPRLVGLPLLTVIRVNMLYPEMVILSETARRVAGDLLNTVADISDAEIPAEQLAVAVQVAGDLSASGVPQAIVLLMDNRDGGLSSESLPQFTPDFELVMHLDDSGDLAISVNEFQDDAGFQPMAQGGEFAGTKW